MSDGEMIDNGYNTFLHTFAHMMEHKGRSVPNVERVHPNAAIATGAVVVQEQMFNPHLDEEEISDQKDMKDRLSEIFHTCRETEWPTLEIDKLMHQSYGLQRQDIVQGTRIIEEEETEDADLPENNQQCIQRLRDEWPFLFQTKWQSAHYLQLTAAPIDLAIAQYAEEHLTLIMDYLLTNNTDTAIKCLILKKQWEAANSNPKTRFMLAVTMIATYFQEDIKSFFLKAERTTPPTEVHRLEGISGAPTVVALNQNIFLATKFFVCIDQQLVLEAYTSEDAIKSVIQAAFIFSTHYPNSLKHTFEFLERIVCKLTSSRLSEPMLVMTPIVLRLINGIRKFQEKYRILSESI
ncbi:uncharacterized protein LOC117652051 [Thrips palmi]|uniref:Uncharacterized protein LOC117652051 n=1 Tax=Thrips palmi TaxID=161013 RepID=A0A6P9A8G0_THRPL|nr:uncharacterized protein LOC117652051 [Thrips palmi]